MINRWAVRAAETLRSDDEREMPSVATGTD
jgi:hypothetical protein